MVLVRARSDDETAVRRPVCRGLHRPWITPRSATRPFPEKAWFYHRAAAAIEPFVLRSAAHVTAVSWGILEDLRGRYPWLEAGRMSAMPYGADPDDLEAAVRLGLTPPDFSGDDEDLTISFTGAVQPTSQPLVVAFLRALGALDEARPATRRRVRLRAYGTSNLTWGHGRHTILPVARELGVDHLVSEIPERIPYLQAMSVLQASGMVLVMGSTDAYYHASKLYPAIVSGRPVLAICHRDSSITRVVEQTGAGLCVTFVDPLELSVAGRRDRQRDRIAGPTAASHARCCGHRAVYSARVDSLAGARPRSRHGSARPCGGDMSERETIGIGVIGLGHWGPNHVRVFSQVRGAEVVAAADPSADRRRHLENLYRGLTLVADPMDVLNRPDVDAVVIATPARTHFELAAAALEAGKHVLLEKPMCTTLADAQRLHALAARAGRVMVHGHVFLYNAGIRYLRDGIASGRFGAVQYLHATRTNLGPIRNDVNVVADLATHELTIFDYLLGRSPNWVSATGSRLLGTALEDVAFVTLEFGDSLLAHVHVSWINPQKIRSLTVVGSHRMVVWDDMQPLEPIRVYDKGVMEEPYYDSFGEFQLRLRDADIVIPKLALQEPLRVQAEAFIRRLTSGEPTPSEAESGVRVVACLEAIQQSLREEGRRVHLAGVAVA